MTAGLSIILCINFMTIIMLTVAVLTISSMFYISTLQSFCAIAVNAHRTSDSQSIDQESSSCSFARSINFSFKMACS